MTSIPAAITASTARRVRRADLVAAGQQGAVHVDDAEPDRGEAVVEVAMVLSKVSRTPQVRQSAPLGDREEHHRVLEGVESVAGVGDEHEVAG